MKTTVKLLAMRIDDKYTVVHNDEAKTFYSRREFWEHMRYIADEEYTEAKNDERKERLRLADDTFPF